MKGSDIGIQEKKAKLFNEWERFTSTDGESIESYYHRFSKLMNDFKRNKHFPEKIASNLKFLNNLQPEWSRHVTIVHQTKDLHTAHYTQLYDFLKYNQKEVDDLRAERLLKIHDPLALMANSNNPFNYPVFHPDQPSPNRCRWFRQCGISLEQVSGKNVGNQNRYNSVQNVRNQVVHNVVKNPSVQTVGNQNGLSVVPGIANKNLNGNDNVVAAPAEGNAIRNNADLDEIEEVNENCILMANFQQASTSGTQTDKAPVSSMEQDGGTADQHPATVEETRAYFESIYNNLEKSTVSSLLEEKKKLKSDFKIREDELLDKQIHLENTIKELDNILVKMGDQC
ncbi:hypothetical protein Tco_0216179 [Tanacetum coccineum]